MFLTRRSVDTLLVDITQTGMRKSETNLGGTAYDLLHEVGTYEGRIENYIPLRPCDLRDRLVGNNPETFTPAATKTKFLQLYELLKLRSKIRIVQKFGEWQETYAYLDPDVDVQLPQTGSQLDCFERKKLADQFEVGFSRLLDVAEFKRISPEELNAAMSKKSLWGVEMTPPPSGVEFSVFYRGMRQVKLEYRSWTTLFRKVAVQVAKYERLVIAFKLVNNHSPPKRWFPLYRRPTKVAAVRLEQGHLYLKLFKDILQPDVDMLIPGSAVKLSILDYLLVWCPILFGLGSGIYKAWSGTFNFSTVSNMLTSLALVAIPLSWGFKAYTEHKKKLQDMRGHLNKVFLMHNVTNNSSVLSHLLDEAHDQELSEVLLAYFYLWKGDDHPAPQHKAQLDKSVEDFLDALMVEHGIDVKVDYEVADAIVLLRQLGLVAEVPGQPSNGTSQACGIDQALERASLKHVKLWPHTSNQQVPELGTPPTWQECVGLYPATGHKVRYFLE